MELAFSTSALIVGLHVKADQNAMALALRRDVSIELYDVIYKLLEALAERAEKERVVETVKSKIGEAIVRRVFDIKESVLLQVLISKMVDLCETAM